MSKALLGDVQGGADAGEPLDPIEPAALAADPQRAWQLADEARSRGQWALAAKLVRLARGGVSDKTGA